ncbi:MAG: MaoC/PaaZ C-terminal domain-containing protein [Vicingaceae bacterium]
MILNRGLLNSDVDLGKKLFTKEEIIDFAKINDPLSFHTDIEIAKKSRFKGLVCSGSQAFNFFYVNRWIPNFGDAVIAGLSVNNWNFLAPIYMDDMVEGKCSIVDLKETKKKGEAVIKWGFEFLVNSEKVQELELTVLMNLNKLDSL